MADDDLIADDDLTDEEKERLEQFQRGMKYIRKLPKKVPDGKWLAHNQVKPHSRKSGRNGFRYWLADPNGELYVLCGCDWAKELGWHYRVRAIWDKE